MSICIAGAKRAMASVAAGNGYHAAHSTSESLREPNLQPRSAWKFAPSEPRASDPQSHNPGLRSGDHHQRPESREQMVFGITAVPVGLGGTRARVVVLLAAAELLASAAPPRTRVRLPGLNQRAWVVPRHKAPHKVQVYRLMTERTVKTKRMADRTEPAVSRRVGERGEER